MTDIVERLLKVESSTYETGSRTGALCGTTNWYRNPDGPEAADEIKRLRKRYDALVDELREIVAENEGLRARLAEAERDAARYRFLRNQPGNPSPEEFEAMIDGDMADELAADKGTGMRGFQNVDDPSLLPPPTYPPESENDG